MTRSGERKARIQGQVAKQEALKGLRAKRRRLWPVYGVTLAISPLVYWIGNPAVWMLYGAAWMLLLSLDLLIAQRMYSHEGQRVEAVIVGAGLVPAGFSVVFMLILAVRMMFGG